MADWLRAIRLVLTIWLGVWMWIPAPVAAATPPPDGGPYIHLVWGTLDPSRLPSVGAKPTKTGVYIVQFVGPVQAAWKASLRAAGGQIGGYLPDDAFVVRLEADALARVAALPFVRWIGPYRSVYKLPPALLKGTATAPRSYRLYLAPWGDLRAAQAALRTMGIAARVDGRVLAATLDEAQLHAVAERADVLWIEPRPLMRPFNNVGGGEIMRGSVAWTNGYHGEGVTVAVADSGLDTGDPTAIHADFAGRVAHISSWPVVPTAYTEFGDGCVVANAGADDGPADLDTGHGTHVTGSVAGNGARSGGLLKGLAYSATITFQAVEQYVRWRDPADCLLPEGYYLAGIPDDTRQLLAEAYGWGARVYNVSWGGDAGGAYDETAAQFDDFVYNHPDMVIVVAAGNGGYDGDGDGYVDEGSISTPALAKNVIAVGATESERATGGYQYTWGRAWPDNYPSNPTAGDHLSNSREHMAAFSGRGPTADGRLKPDVVAPGTNIVSTRSSRTNDVGWGVYSDAYVYMGGTSMASPLTAGAVALVRQRYLAQGVNPSAALIKATLAHTAVDIAGYGDPTRGAGQPVPNVHEGWGRVDVGAATASDLFRSWDGQVISETGAVWSYEATFDGSRPLEVTLVWSDPPALPSAARALVNDLDLYVVAPDGQFYRGNFLLDGVSQPGGYPDTVNNVERVYIAGPTAGTWRIEVRGTNIPQGPQPFALVLSGYAVETSTLEVEAITPDRAYNGSPITVTVDGAGFVSPTLRLVRASAAIAGETVAVQPGGTRFTATLDLRGATPGVWDVVVQETGGVSRTLPAAFTLLDASLPDLEVSKRASATWVRPGDRLTYTIAIRNRTGVATEGVVFTETLPVSVTFVSITPPCDAGTVALPGGFVCRLPDGGTLQVSGAVTYTLVVRVGADAWGTLTNRVTVGHRGADADATNDTASAVVTASRHRLLLPLILRQEAAPSPPLSAPHLYPIENDDEDGVYVLAWSPLVGFGAVTYDVEEDGQLLLTGHGETFYRVETRVAGTHTYRVRGRTAQEVGPWSAPQEAVVSPMVNNPVRNGDFEQGSDGSWVEYSKWGYPLILSGNLPITPHSGSWLAWLGGAFDEVSELSQRVTVPADATRLVFWYAIGSEEVECGRDVGYLRVNGTVYYTFDLCMGQGDTWQMHVEDLSSFAGQEVELAFYVSTDDVWNSNLFLDDVMLTAP